jgi:hypothetical protein
VSPRYAILLKGPWGSGKTWFINKFMGNSPHKFLYVSLYGLTSSAEIEEAFFQQLHPILSHKSVKLAGAILKGMLKLGVKVDWTGDGKADATVSLKNPGVSLQDHLSKTRERILVFDDLERCSMPISDVLGYINYFVEHQDHKVIILANEDKILRGDDEKNQRYEEIKEKLIGYSFELKPRLEDAFSAFVAEMPEPEVQRFFNDHADLIRETYLKSDKHNLRALRHTMLALMRVRRKLPRLILENNNVLREFLARFIALSIEIYVGTLKPSEIADFSSNPVTCSDGSEESKCSKIERKYDCYRLGRELLPSKLWEEIIGNGFVDSEQVKQATDRSSFSPNDKTPTWIKLWSYARLSDVEFTSALSALENEFEEKKLREPGELKQIAGILLNLSELGLYEKNKQNITKDIIFYVDSLQKENLLSCNFADFPGSFDGTSWGGYGFQGYDLDEFQKIRKYIEQKVTKARKGAYPEILEELLFHSKEDVSELVQVILGRSSKPEFARDVPVFLFVNATTFFTTYEAMEHQNQRLIRLAFEERYEHLQKCYLEELPFLKMLNEHLAKAEQERGPLPSKVCLGRFIKTTTGAIEAIKKAEET